MSGRRRAGGLFCFDGPPSPLPSLPSLLPTTSPPLCSDTLELGSPPPLSILFSHDIHIQIPINCVRPIWFSIGQVA